MADGPPAHPHPPRGGRLASGLMSDRPFGEDIFSKKKGRLLLPVSELAHLICEGAGLGGC